ncbi:hypothetical protein HGRIS_014583 [Hohenbuehelia grisea]|uniref:Flavin-containing monooxygenase n=1 Tax=Hohenbuehelia grisea TaxID=104357 RepID=A0ABR3JU59_9AGAR
MKHEKISAEYDEPPLTPLYDSLTTNLPHPVMAYTCFPFPPSTPMYPKAEVVRTYLKAFASHFNLLPFIRFKTLVEDVRRNDDNTRWLVKLSDRIIREFDLVIVSNGHYRVPSYPDTPGLSKWLTARKAVHSAWYRRPIDLGRRILVIGDGPSARDISAEMAAYPGTQTVIRSISKAANADSGTLRVRGRVAEYHDQGKVIFEDGTVEQDIDYCILATGYKISFRFLPEPILQLNSPPPVPPLPWDVYNSGVHVFPLAKHLFPLQSHYPPTSLAFMCLLTHVVPFPLLEAQARVAIYAFAHPESLDGMREAVDIITRYEELQAEFSGDQRTVQRMWHRFRGQEQFAYRDALHTFAKDDGVEWDPHGAVVPSWVKEAYENKDALRRVWIELEKKGEADSWVRGVGEGGSEEWVAVLRRMLQYARDQNVLQFENPMIGETAKL